MRPLRFYTPDLPGFYEKDGVTLVEEPDMSLEELEQAYTDACKSYHEFRQRQREAEAPYRRTRVVNGKEESYVDYDAWEAADSDSFWSWGLGEFNGFNGIEMLEFDIDLKIMHLNQRESE